MGSADPNQMAYRSGAKENDLICVTGDLGAAYLGLQLLEREKKVFRANPHAQPELREENHYLYQRFLRPDCRDDVWKFLSDRQIKPTSMIDISDGLSSELIHLGQQSKVGIRIYEDKVPIHPAAVEVAKEFHLEPLTCALNGGEDYELLFTIAQADYPTVAANRDVSVIGHVTAAAGRYELVSNGGNTYPLVAQGWQAFRNEET
jgi:thiamine-monophosphate kinase